MRKNNTRINNTHIRSVLIQVTDTDINILRWFARGGGRKAKKKTSSDPYFKKMDVFRGEWWSPISPLSIHRRLNWCKHEELTARLALAARFRVSVAVRSRPRLATLGRVHCTALRCVPALPFQVGVAPGGHTKTRLGVTERRRP